MMARRLIAGRGPAGGVGVQAYPVSVKDVVARDGRVLLLRNEWQEWEVPAGRL